MRKIILTILIISWMIMIFMFSNQPGADSTRTSDGFISRTVGNVYRFVNHNVSDDDIVLIQEKYTHIVRKIAHFSLYLVLGVLVLCLLNEYKLSNIVIYSILICMCYAISDEVHQLFVVGRSGEVKDVLIDSCGSTTGILIVNFILRKINSKN